MTKEFQKKTVLKTAYGAFNREIKLVHLTAGLRLAGSGTIEKGENWAVLYLIGGNQHGQEFKTLAEAQAYFDAYTMPITAVTA